MYLIFPVMIIVRVTVIVLLQCLSCSFGQNQKANIADMHYDYDYDNDKKWVLQSCIFTGQKIHVVKMLGHLSTYFLMKNLNF